MSNPRNTQKGTSSKPLALRSKHSSSKSNADHGSNDTAIVTPDQARKRTAPTSIPSANRAHGQAPQKSTIHSQTPKPDDGSEPGGTTVVSQTVTDVEKSALEDEIRRAPEVLVDGFPRQDLIITYGKDETTKVVSAYQLASSKPSKGSGRDGSGKDPNDNRRGSSKRIKETPGNTETAFPEYKRRDRKDFTIGTVFQMLHTPPDRPQRSTMTPFTTPALQGNTFVRRYAVIQGIAPNSDDGFLALPILTHEGQGVAKPGVVKRHHAIIYTRRPAPQVTTAELPQRMPDGTPEDGMLPNSIRVTPRHHSLALDPMARINFGNPITFDYGVRVELFGRVHENSMQDFIFQFRHVWTHRQNTSEHQAPHGSIDPGTSHPPLPAPVASPTTRLTVPVPLSQNPATQVAAGPSTSAASRARNDSGVSFPGPIDVQVIINAIETFRHNAEQQDMPPPPDVTSDGLQTMAQNHEVRLQYFDAYKALWNRARQAKTQEH